MTDIKLCEMYYNEYLNNLEYLLSIFPYKFLHPSELFPCEYMDKTQMWETSTDSWLTESKYSRDSLAIDILENGMYWPFIIDNKHTVYEGQHRAHSLNLIDVPQHNKYLCLTISNLCFDIIEDEICEFIEPRDIIVPNILLDKLERMYVVGGYTYESVNEHLTKVSIRDFKAFVMLFVDFAAWLRELIFSLRREGIVLRGADIINDKEAFNLWRQSGKRNTCSFIKRNIT